MLSGVNLLLHRSNFRVPSSVICDWCKNHLIVCVHTSKTKRQGMLPNVDSIIGRLICRKLNALGAEIPELSLLYSRGQFAGEPYHLGDYSNVPQLRRVLRILEKEDYPEGPRRQARRNPPKLQSSFAKASEDTRIPPRPGGRGFLRRRVNNRQLTPLVRLSIV